MKARSKASNRSLKGRIVTAATLALFAATRSVAAIVFDVSFDDPGSANSAFYADITSHVQAAGAAWSDRLTGDATLETVIRFDSGISTATGRSVTTSFVENDGSFDIFQQGIAAEINGIADPNGSGFDFEMTFSPAYLANGIWFDPTPYDNIEPVPGDRVDALSVVTHEIGHALAFNGWRSGTDNSLPGDYMSTWDRHVIFDGSNMFFTGANAVAVYGGNLPVTFGNPNHIGNDSPRPGSDLISDLMNGIVFTFGTRYEISDLDWAILEDAGLDVTPVPEPASVGLTAAVLCAGFAWWRRGRR